jgi:hypothetical protein
MRSARTSAASEPKDPQWEIVGVLGDTRHVTRPEDEPPTASVPLASRGATLELRTSLAPEGLEEAVKGLVASVDTNLPVMRLRTQSDEVENKGQNWHSTLWVRLLDGKGERAYSPIPDRGAV